MPDKTNSPESTLAPEKRDDATDAPVTKLATPDMPASGGG